MGLMDALQDPLFWRDVRRNAKDLGQSASNAALSNVTGPVDMANSLLGLLGIKSAEPVGGSKWAERVGLSRQVNQGLPQVVGETLGLVAPFAGARAPQVANKLLEYTDNAMAPSAANQAARNQLGAIVYHGSPHKFDRFDASKIGTGEGAQAYGHGLYFAESPEVAKQYSVNLSDISKLTPEGMAARVLSQTGDDIVAARQFLYRQYNEATSPAMQNSALKAIDALNSGLAKSPTLYKVDLPDNAIARMLDWDKPLSQQAPEVQAAVESVMAKRAAESEAQRLALNAQYPNRTTHPVLSKIVNKPKTAFDYKGEAAVSQLVQELGGPDKAAAFLRQQGIPGIRYLDGMSRGAGQGSSNYVVFPGEEGLLSILERNGSPLR